MNKNSLFSADTYTQRRDILRKKIGSGKILLLGNGDSSINFKDNWYPFRQDSTFLYYFGIAQPDLIGVLDCDSGADIMYGNDLSMDDIVWTGPQPTIAELAEMVGVNRSESLDRLALEKGNTRFLPAYRGEHVLSIQNILGVSQTEAKENYSVDLIKAVVAQRSIKSPEEVEELHKAVNYTSAMHLAVMQAARPGLKEHELVGVATQVAHNHNVALSFPPIMTIDGQTLHNHYYGNTMKEGDMLLFDGGTESEKFYAGDMTRTFPVGARFSTRQKELYDTVYNAHRAAIDGLKPGVKYVDLHLLAAKKLVEGLKEVGIMKGDAEEAVAAGAHTMFFQCGTGHMMGLDVHDMENLGEEYVGYTPENKKKMIFGLKSLRLGKALQPGYVLTVEPGIYIIPELIDKFKAEKLYHNFIDYNKLEAYRDFGGIRIEEDFLITNKGSELLGTPLATASEEVEEIRRIALS